MNIKNNLILALDVTNKDKAIEICKEVSPYINTIKIGYPLTLAEGLEIIKIIKDEFGANIICDYKVADIDATNSKICDLTFDAGADAIICHGFVGSDSVQACLDSANNTKKTHNIIQSINVLIVFFPFLTRTANHKIANTAITGNKKE